MRRSTKPQVAQRTYSDVEKFRRRLASAEQHLRRAEVHYDDLHARLGLAADSEREDLAKREWLARLNLNDAQEYAAACRRKLAAEESRLLQPDSFLRFT